MKSWRGLSALMIVATTTAGVRAQAPTPVERLASEAALAYRNGDFGHALALLQQAYQLRPVTPILYNLAKTYDKLGERGQAIAHYARYVAAEDADARLKVKAQERIDALAASPAATAPPEEAPPVPARTPVASAALPLAVPPPVSAAPEPRAEPRVEPLRPESPAGPLPEARAPEPRPLTLAPPRASDQLRRQHLYRDLGLCGSALGLASIGAAIGLGSSARSLHDQFAATFAEDAKRSLRDRSQAEAVAADALFAVGGVALAGSAVFYALWLRRPARAQATALVPWVTPAQLGLSLATQF
jgi:hypothetical protein